MFMKFGISCTYIHLEYPQWCLFLSAHAVQNMYDFNISLTFKDVLYFSCPADFQHHP